MRNAALAALMIVRFIFVRTFICDRVPGGLYKKG